MVETSGLSLVILAAGMGSRYGGLKQLDPVGPSGEVLLDYSVYDAVQAGFSEVIFVIRHEIEEQFRSTLGSRYQAAFPELKIQYAFQEIMDLPKARLFSKLANADEAQGVDGAQQLSVHEVLEGASTDATQGFAAVVELRKQSRKPWGTGHALLAVRDLVSNPFAVINADDYYGPSGYRLLANFLKYASNNQYAMVGYQLKNTLSEHGAVSRGICQSTADGFLTAITEQTSLRRTAEGIISEQQQEKLSGSVLEPVFIVAAADERPGADGAEQLSLQEVLAGASTGATKPIAAAVDCGGRFSGNELVSLNFWAFMPDLFPRLEKAFGDFLTSPLYLSNPATAEFYLPSAISSFIQAGEVTVRLLSTEDSWFGLTHPADLPQVKAALQQRVAEGKYPSPLFGD